MEALNERQHDILAALVGFHIQTGEPVSSDDLRRRYRFHFSPATIRNELLRLDEAGYLEQPHTSAGRVPTDKGYRWYVNQLESRRVLHPGSAGGENKRRQLMESLETCDDPEEFFRRVAGTLSDMVHVMTVSGSLEDTGEPFYKSGFGNVLSAPELMDLHSRHSFGTLVDSIDRVIRQVSREVESTEAHVFIGDENPVREARDYSMLIQKIEMNGIAGVIALIGPKRMRYERGLALLRALEDIA
ncbi:MAG TPA: hypothetical protein VJK04_02410 [Candidatus Paceibacterota bacterium]